MKKIIPLLFTIVGCLSASDRVACLNSAISENQRCSEYAKIKMAITDSIKSWADMGLQHTSNYQPERSNWKVDEFLFNKDKSKIFGWILQVDADSKTDMTNIDSTDVLDYVNFFSGEKRNGEWFFYIHNMPGIFFAREDNAGQPYSFKYLSARAKMNAVNGGIIGSGDCRVNSQYINGWIDRKDRKLFEWHQEFLMSHEEKLD